MTIVFICGSLEPGKDGVGDYTRRLAAELISQGHFCAIIALMDKFINQPFEKKQIVDNNTLSIFRLPFIIGFKKNSNTAKSWIDDFQPDWVSLQYVPFAFNNKGLPFGLGKALKNLLAPYKLHIMFHELWVGMQIESSLKLRVSGIAQKKLIKNFILQVKPDSISTHSTLYQFHLQQLGYPVFILPLISSFSLCSPFNHEPNNGTLRFIIFGNIHHDAPIDSFAENLGIYCKANNLSSEVIFIGKNGGQLNNWVEIFKSNKITTNVVGEQSEDLISKYLSSANIGLTSTPYFLIEKSSAIAAMREFKLPIICVASKYTVQNFFDFKGLPYVFEYNKNNFSDILFKISSNKYTFPRFSVSKLFLENITFK